MNYGGMIMTIVRWIGLLVLSGVMIFDLMFFGTFVKIALIQSDYGKDGSYLTSPNGITASILLLICAIIAGLCGFFIYKLMLSLNLNFGLIWNELTQFAHSVYHQIQPVAGRITLKSILMLLLGIAGVVVLGCTVFFCLLLLGGIGGHHGPNKLTPVVWTILMGIATPGVIMLWFSIKYYLVG